MYFIVQLIGDYKIQRNNNWRERYRVREKRNMSVDLF